jgi:hypothetical protein
VSVELRVAHADELLLDRLAANLQPIQPQAVAVEAEPTQLGEEAAREHEPLQGVPRLHAARRVALWDGDPDQADADDVSVDVGLDRVPVDRTEEPANPQVAASRLRRRPRLRDVSRGRIRMCDRRADQADRDDESEE